MNASPDRKRVTVVLLAVLLGSAWGAIEMSLGAFLHFIHFPLKGVVLGGIGAALMISFISLTRKPNLVLWLGLIAASWKLLDAVVLGIPPGSPAIVNPVAAIVLEALAVRVAGGVLLRRESGRVMAHTLP